MDSSKGQADIFGMFHAFLTQYWSPDRMGMKANSFQEMISNAHNALESTGITQWVPGLEKQLTEAQTFMKDNPGNLSAISSILGGFQ